MPWSRFSGDAGVLTSLPSNPVNGQEFVYQTSVMAASGVAWRMKYNSNSSSSNKWEFVGGGELTSFSTTSYITNSTSWTQSPSIAGGALPTITIPATGDWRVTIFMANAFTNVSGGYECYLNFGINNSNPAVTDDNIQFVSTGNSYKMGPQEKTSFKSLTTSDVLKLYAAISNSAANFYIGANDSRSVGFRIQPIRLA